MPIPNDPVKAALWRERQRLAQTGKSRNAGANNPMFDYHFDDTEKQIRSERMLGEKNPMFGLSRPQHVKDAVGNAHRGTPSPFKGRKHSTASREAMSEARKGNQNRKGRPFTPDQREALGPAKRATAARGPRNGQWKGGVTPENVAARHLPEYAQWRKQVYDRDSYTCQHCGDNRGRNLHPHHLKPFSDHPELRFEVSNGMTLCKPCHEQVHKRRF